MTNSGLHAALTQLRSELERTDLRDPAAKAHLQQLIDDLDRHAGDDSAGPERQALAERVGESIRRFEVEHPSFTGYLSQIVSALSNMGI